MRFVARFVDRPDRLEIRKQLLAAHLEWLDAHRSIVLVAGSLRPDPDAAPVGALWIVEAGSKAEIEELLEGDPFWRNGLRQSCEILLWSKAFPDREAAV